MKYYIGKFGHYMDYQLIAETIKFHLDEELKPEQVMEFVASEWHKTHPSDKPNKFSTDIPNIFEYSFDGISIVVEGHQEIDKATYELLQIIPEVDIQDWFLEGEL